MAEEAKADYEVNIRLVGKTVKPVPDLLDPMRVGKTVRYSSPDGVLRMEFDAGGSPYQETVLTNGQIATLIHAGKFKGRCSLTPHGQTTPIGWPKDPDSGGDHNVEL